MKLPSAVISWPNVPGSGSRPFAAIPVVYCLLSSVSFQLHKDATEILFTVVTRLEISRLTNEVEKIDPLAFIVMQSIKDTRGGMVKKRPLK
jgi:hypothetical protein